MNHHSNSKFYQGASLLVTVFQRKRESYLLYEIISYALKEVKYIILFYFLSVVVSFFANAMIFLVEDNHY